MAAWLNTNGSNNSGSGSGSNSGKLDSSPADLRVEVLPQGEDWRVVGWPYARRGEADQARSLLVSRGLRVEVVAY